MLVHQRVFAMRAWDSVPQHDKPAMSWEQLDFPKLKLVILSRFYLKRLVCIYIYNIYIFSLSLSISLSLYTLNNLSLSLYIYTHYISKSYGIYPILPLCCWRNPRFPSFFSITGSGSPGFLMVPRSQSICSARIGWTSKPAAVAVSRAIPGEFCESRRVTVGGFWWLQNG